MPNANRTYIERTIERLYGIIEGISIDCQINDDEIIALQNWIQMHEMMDRLEPFKSLIALLRDILIDQVIEEVERDDLLDWCAETINEKGFLKDTTQVIRRLHGVLSGIKCDHKIEPDELKGLRDWLYDYEHLGDLWPLNEVRQMIATILDDGEIDAAEQKWLSTFFHDFMERVIEKPVIHDDEYWLNEDMISPSPIFKPISIPCEKNPMIEFAGKQFCFTGPAVSARREELSDVVQKFGGHASKSVSKGIDYLVIGAQASPAWVYSPYGRKIEAVMTNKKNDDWQTQIIAEADFIQAVGLKTIQQIKSISLK